MCLVCHKIMTQRKLDTIKRHTIRRHAELLSMSETERQRLYHDLVTQYFRRGGDFCGDSDPFCATSVPRLRQPGPRGSRVEVAGVRRHPRLIDVPSPPIRARMSVPRRSAMDKHSLACPPPSEQALNQIKPTPAMPMNLKTFENILFNGPYSIFTKYLMGFNPTQVENFPTFHAFV